MRVLCVLCSTLSRLVNSDMQVVVERVSTRYVAAAGNGTQRAVQPHRTHAAVTEVHSAKEINHDAQYARKLNAAGQRAIR